MLSKRLVAQETFKQSETSGHYDSDSFGHLFHYEQYVYIISNVICDAIELSNQINFLCYPRNSLTWYWAVSMTNRIFPSVLSYAENGSTPLSAIYFILSSYPRSV